MQTTWFILQGLSIYKTSIDSEKLSDQTQTYFYPFKFHFSIHLNVQGASRNCPSLACLTHGTIVVATFGEEQIKNCFRFSAYDNLWLRSSSAFVFNSKSILLPHIFCCYRCNQLNQFSSRWESKHVRRDSLPWYST